MANSTQNFKLIKPLQEEFYNVDDFNKNADLIDDALTELVIKKAPSGFGLGTAATDISGQDLNADRATGFYRGTNLANTPSQGGWWYVINMSHSDTAWYYQQAASYGSDNSPSIIFVRTKTKGVWSAWKQVATTDGTIANADTVDGKHASAFAPSGFGLGIQKNLLENANLILNTGFYYCTTGLPSGVSDANVYHHAHSDAYAHQMAFEFGPNYDNTVYSRIKNNNVWSAWKQVATTDKVLPLTGGTLTGQLTVPTIYTPDWFKTTGDTGWYNQKWGGGWHMSDATWIRAYNDKNVYTKGVFQADGGFNGALHGTADNSNKLIGKTWNWSGQSGQPTWLWGGSDGTNMYVYNPSNFNVNYANGAGNVNGYTADALKNRVTGRGTPVFTPLLNTSKGLEVSNYAGTGITAQGNGDIYLTQSYKNFDKILIEYTNDNTEAYGQSLWEQWELSVAFSTAYFFSLHKALDDTQWYVYGNTKRGTADHPLSSETVWKLATQNSRIIQIYGINY
ncbi:pyocin knob domain-containing protein [Propionispira raffinosivorans]|uniref:pyocin knob domain-containing protein n=1 Tax=Propionispira raffinosivorans TaxID=86959 RepID=UPI000382DCEF|nr:pyocin knob domain-containing protein [Propionispira raffinosivorans]